MRLRLTQGQETVFDDADWPRIARYRWYTISSKSGYYAMTKIKWPDGRRRVIGMHRLLMDDPPGRRVDHISRDTLDNRRQNLRAATDSQNKTNARLYRNNTTGFRGVRRWADPRLKPWYAQVSLHGKRHHLGSFVTMEEAIRAYDAAARALHGEYASLNVPDDD